MIVYYKDGTTEEFNNVYDCFSNGGMVTVQYNTEERRIYPKDYSGRTIADQSEFYYDEVMIPLTSIKRISGLSGSDCGEHH
jgi:hypothetical protein